MGDSTSRVAIVTGAAAASAGRRARARPGGRVDRGERHRCAHRPPTPPRWCGRSRRRVARPSASTGSATWEGADGIVAAALDASDGSTSWSQRHGRPQTTTSAPLRGRVGPEARREPQGLLRHDPGRHAPHGETAAVGHRQTPARRRGSGTPPTALRRRQGARGRAHAHRGRWSSAASASAPTPSGRWPSPARWRSTTSTPSAGVASWTSPGARAPRRWTRRPCRRQDRHLRGLAVQRRRSAVNGRTFFVSGAGSRCSASPGQGDHHRDGGWTLDDSMRRPGRADRGAAESLHPRRPPRPAAFEEGR